MRGSNAFLSFVKGQAGGHSSRASWELEKRYVVRGHWRMQPHGKGRAERRRQWIQPFWKGPATVAEALSRAFTVDL